MLLYVLAVPLPLAAVVALAGGALLPAAFCALAFGLVVAGGNLNRRAMLEELVTPERRFARAPRHSLKYLAAGLVAGGTALAAWGGAGQSAAVGTVFGLLALFGFHLSYRLPAPAQVLGGLGARRPQGGVEAALAQAEGRILAIEKAALSVGNTELGERLGRVAAKGRAILGVIAERPEERFRARKFLNVYLEGAERVAGKFVKTHRLTRGRTLEQNFRNVLVDIERVFDQQLESLAEQDVFDLDVQIEVLRRQLEREGIA
jgi:hypothetical protein